MKFLETEGKRMHMLNKSFLFAPKHNGDLGFIYLSFVNEPLLAKQGCKWVFNPQSLTSVWFLNKYKIPNTEFKFHSTSQDLWCWRGICNSLSLIDDKRQMTSWKWWFNWYHQQILEDFMEWGSGSSQSMWFNWQWSPGSHLPWTIVPVSWSNANKIHYPSNSAHGGFPHLAWRCF